MAAGRSVVATRVGGPPEFVPPEAGVLVDPLDTAALADAMRRAADAAETEPGGPRPPRPSTTSGVRRRRSSRSWSEPLEVGEPDLDERAHALLEPRLARDGERLLVALAGLCGETPCFSRLSPVTRSFWICSRASELFTREA